MCYLSEEFNDICPDYTLKSLMEEKILNKEDKSDYIPGTYFYAVNNLNIAVEKILRPVKRKINKIVEKILKK